MTITTTNRYALFIGNGVTTVFPYTFEIPSADALQVSLQDAISGELIQVLAPGSYSVTGLGSPTGGSVGYNPGTPIPSTQALVILRTVPYTQQLDIENQGGFFPDTLEQQLDFIVMQIQQLAEEITRAVVTSIGQSPPTIEEINAIPGYAAAAAASADAAAASAASINPSSTVLVNRVPIFASFMGTPTLFSTGSVFNLAAGAYDDTMSWYFQREAGYSNGGTSDGDAGVLSAIRAETYSRASVGFAVECGLIGLSQNYSYKAQGVGVYGGGNAYNDSRVWGGVFEAHEWYDEFTVTVADVTASRKSWSIANGYTANSLTVLQNGTQITRGASAGQFSDADGANLVLVTTPIAGTVVRTWRGNPKTGKIGIEVNVFSAYGTDTANIISGDRIMVAAIPKRQDSALAIDSHIGTGFLVGANIDNGIVVDRAFSANGRIVVGMDLSNATLTGNAWNSPGSKISNIGNIAAGDQDILAAAGTATINIGRVANGGVFRAGDGTHAGRMSVSSAAGMTIGTETAIPVILQYNNGERARLAADGLHQILSAIATPLVNGDLVIQATSNTSLTFKLKGSDGVVRSASLTLS